MVMLNLITSLNKKRANTKLDASYNKKFMNAWLNLELISQEDKLIATRNLIEGSLN